MARKKYNIDWSDELINFIKTSYPHFGLQEILQTYDISRDALRSKVNGMGLKTLPKEDRICMSCKNEKQYKRHYLCHECFNKSRYFKRRETPVSIKSHLRELLRTARHRSSVKSDLTVECIIKLLNDQHGRCFYSGIEMEFRSFGSGRSPYSVSIDQVIPGGGYTKDNVVLCCWIVNAGKSNLSIEEYLNICQSVASYSKSSKI